MLTGYSLLWLQPLAMILGIIMLASLSYLTLSTGERTFSAINRHVSPVLGWGWLIGSMMANMVWALPQYSLATAAIQQNLLPGVLGTQGSMDPMTAKYLIVGVIFVISTCITWSYGSGHWGVRLYEKMLKIIVALIVLCFVLVKSTISDSELAFGDILKGFIPSYSSLYEPSEAYQAMLNNIGESYRPFWRDYILTQQIDVAMAAFATAVGINMTFLLAYSLLGRNGAKNTERFPSSI
ncbi:MAG: divalent metal cation transporter [Planctomycetaceae bacterium]